MSSFGSFKTAALAALSLLGSAAANAPSSPSPSSSTARQIAIIGAGAAGSSAAYHLEQFAAAAGRPVNITILEKTDRIGGRTLTVNAYDNPAEPVELGASIFVEVNHILYDAAQQFGLPLSHRDDATGEIIGVWDGTRGDFVLTLDQSSWLGWGKFLWRYGLAPRRTQNLMVATVNKFLKLYEAPFFPFTSLTQRVFDLDLATATADTGEQFLQKNGISAAYAHDIVQTSTRVNYASNLARIHGLDTMVSMAPQGAMQVEGGNWQIFFNMVARSNAAVFLNTSVAAIRQEKPEDESAAGAADRAPSKAKYIIDTAGDDSPALLPFDDVVVATPWQFAGIDAAEGLLQEPIDEIPYVRLHVTLFTSPLLLSQGFFGVNMSADKMPNTILTTLGPDDTPSSGAQGVGSAGFFSISTLREVVNPATGQPEFLYKIFSPEAVTPGFLGLLLGAPVPDNFTTGRVRGGGGAADAGGAKPVSWFHAHVFHSYPRALPRVTFQDPVVGDGLYYTSGIESFISTMETSALMGKNVARLIADDVLGVAAHCLGVAGGAGVPDVPDEAPLGDGADGPEAGQVVLGSDL